MNICSHTALELAADSKELILLKEYMVRLQF